MISGRFGGMRAGPGPTWEIHSTLTPWKLTPEILEVLWEEHKSKAEEQAGG